MERTATARGTSGRIDRDNAVVVEIGGCYGIGWLGLAAEKALDLRECRQDALLRPALDLHCGELQQGRQVLVACDAESARSARLLIRLSISMRTASEIPE